MLTHKYAQAPKTLTLLFLGLDRKTKFKCPYCNADF